MVHFFLAEAVSLATCCHSNGTGTIILLACYTSVRRGVGLHSLTAYLGGYMQANTMLRQPDTKSMHVLDVSRDLPICHV